MSLVASVNWTTVLAAGVAGTAAVVGGLIGLAGVRMTNKAAVFQAESEERREKVQRDEARRDARTDAYSRLLVNIQRLDLMCSSKAPITRATYELWKQDLTNAAIDVQLRGTQPVAQAARKYWQATQTTELVAGAMLVSDADLDDHVRRSYSDMEISDAYDDLLDALRSDAAVDMKPFR